MSPLRANVLTTIALAAGHALAQSPPATQHEYELTVSEENARPAGRVVPRLVVNGQSPGPVLRFREGDPVRIVVRNELADEDASIHWHGLLLPNEMDGVPYLTTPSIPPGGTHTFEFILRQSGTYWYHSHTGLQEQRGVYGAIVIEPREPDLEFDREHVVVLSDWTDEDPDEVMRTLMRGSEWYALRKRNVQSVLGAWRAGALGEFFSREARRMPAMDVSDVAYDAFLANGVEELALDAAPGERVLLRVVNAAASTYFYLSSGLDALVLVGSDGMRVEPVEVRRVLVGMAETYDILVTMPEAPARLELRATAQDGSGHASTWLGAGPARPASDPPPPDIYRMDEMVQAGLASITPRLGESAGTAERPVAPYSLLRAVAPTGPLSPGGEEQVRTLTMRLTGDMQRYLWEFDGKTLAEDAVIEVRQGEVLRIELVNDTMMHHPLHLHGHFFRVLNGQGDHAPLKHTVDVPPMGKRIIEWKADEEGGDWFFHCHLLYHMDAGMARVFRYAQEGVEQTPPSFAPGLIDPLFLVAEGTVQTHMTMGRVKLMSGRDDYYVAWDAGLGHSDHDTYEVDLAWSRYVDTNLSTVVGLRATDEHGARDRAFAGLRYRLPYLAHATLTVDSEEDARIELEKDLQLADRLEVFGDVEYDTNTGNEWEAGLGWTLNKTFGLTAGYHSDHGGGFGLRFSF